MFSTGRLPVLSRVKSSGKRPPGGNGALAELEVAHHHIRHRAILGGLRGIDRDIDPLGGTALGHFVPGIVVVFEIHTDVWVEPVSSLPALSLSGSFSVLPGASA